MDGSQSGFLAFSDSKTVDKNITDKQEYLTSSQTSISTITPESNWASQKLWTSIWLRKDILLGFFTLFTSLYITLVLLMHYNIKVNGFALAPSTNWYIHYTWTYALTVVFTIIASLWRQVDYHCKLSQPWCAMRHGPEVPSKTVLLDYISPLQTASLWRAFKNKHWAVVLSIFGSIILQGIIVASTTVFIPSPTTLDGTFSTTITTRFNGTEYLSTLTSSKTEVSVPLLPFKPINQQPTYDVPNLPLKLYQDILSGDSPSPPEIQDGVVVRLFNHTTDKKVTQITAPTQAFMPNITCEELDNVTFVDYSALRFTFILNSSSCSIGEWSSIARLDSGQISQYEMNRVNCSAGSPIQETSQNAQAAINSTTTDDLRFLLTAIEMKRTDHRNSNHPNDQTWKFLRMTAVLCKVDYSIQDLDLTEFPEDNSFALSPTYNPDENHRIHNLSSIQLGEIIYSMLLDPTVQDDAATTDASISNSIFSHPIFHLMRLASKIPSAESSRFFDAKTMMQAFVTSFGGLACQLIQMKFMLPDQAPGEGKGLYIDERLYAQALSTWIISACLITLSVISLGLVFIAPRESSPQNPSLLASHSTVLARSPSMQAVLKAAGSLRTSELTRWLQNFKFRTSITDSSSFSIDVVECRTSSSQAPSRTIPPKDTEVKDQTRSFDILGDLQIKKGTWIPLFARYPMLLLLLTLPILSIACLEVLYQTSERDNGIVDVETASAYYIRYLSSIAILVIVALFSSLDFTITTFTPFHALRSKQVSASQGILSNLDRSIPPLVFYHAIRRRSWGAFLSSIGRLIASTLTIIVSGLWVTDLSVRYSTQVSALTASTWDLSWENSIFEDGGAASRLPKVIFNSSFGLKGAYDNLVFPDITEVAVMGSRHDDPRFNVSDPATQKYLEYTVRIPALRPRLRCEPAIVHYGERGFEAFYPIPQHCHGLRGDGHDNGTLALGTDSKGNLDENGNVITESKKFNDCPSTSIIFGHLGPDRTSTENITALVCFQEIQIVKAEVSFGFERTDPRSILKLSHSNIRSPPTVDESTAVLMTNAQGLSSLSFSISTNIARVEWEWANDKPDTDWSNFFIPIAYGPNMPSLEAMLGPNNTQLLIDTVNRLYNMYMVRVITSPIFRKPLNGSTDAAAQRLTGTVSTTVPRLKVDYVSKLILQVLLGAMIISGGLGFSLTRIRGTLPRSPFSIASQMALFAGSEFCEPKNMPAGAEWMTKRELETLFGNWQFGLGWWQVPSDCKATPENGPRDSRVTRRFGIDIGTPEHGRFTREKGDAV
ncbi:hypothetical protein K445DRAFT_305258 [Daldinia sp. EC12]|nr:hypothetical protein K445DRAFT_305258 [Daldinia sp. EC12]